MSVEFKNTFKISKLKIRKDGFFFRIFFDFSILYNAKIIPTKGFFIWKWLVIQIKNQILKFLIDFEGLVKYRFFFLIFWGSVFRACATISRTFGCIWTTPSYPNSSSVLTDDPNATFIISLEAHAVNWNLLQLRKLKSNYPSGSYWYFDEMKNNH